MPRTYVARTLVALPRLDAAGARALAHECITVADNRRLPVAMQDAVADIKTQVHDVEIAVDDQTPSADVEPTALRESDVEVDACWRSLSLHLEGWTMLPRASQAAIAAPIYQALFSTGMRFTQLPFRAEWAESKSKLDMIDRRDFAASLDELGATPILKTLRKAHARYGDLLGITTEHDTVATVKLRDALTGLEDALSNYVVQATAMKRARSPSHRKMADELLAPIVNCASSASKPAAPADPTPPATPPTTAPPTGAPTTPPTNTTPST